jgi:hypothetical protein
MMVITHGDVCGRVSNCYDTRVEYDEQFHHFLSFLIKDVQTDEIRHFIIIMTYG